jgi:hypothetical protein
MNRLRTAAVVCALATLGSAVGRAQNYAWDNVCSVGSLQVCASIHIGVQHLGAGPNPWDMPRTTFTIRLRNLQGTLGHTPWSLALMGFGNMKVSGLPEYIFPWWWSRGFIEDGARYTPSLLPEPGFGQPVTDFPTGLEFTIGASGDRASLNTDYDIANWRPLVGCDRPANLPRAGNEDGSLEEVPFGVFGYFSTCGTGWVVHELTMPGEWDFDDQSGFAVRGFSDTGEWTAISVQPTPEPMTIVLFGTGLAGIGAARRRRKAKPSL